MSSAPSTPSAAAATPTNANSANSLDVTFALLLQEISETGLTFMNKVRKEGMEELKKLQKNHLHATGLLVKVEDPMFEALYNEMRTLRKDLKDILLAVSGFLKSVETVSEASTGLSNLLIKHNGLNAKYSQPSLAYSQAVNNFAIGGSRLTTRGILEEAVMFHVIIQVEQQVAMIDNLERQLRNYDSIIVYMRALKDQIAALKKRGAREEEFTAPTSDLDKLSDSYNVLSKSLFTDMTTLVEAKPYIIATLFENFQKAQYAYFNGAADALRPLALPPPAFKREFVDKPLDEADDGSWSPTKKATEAERVRRVSVSLAIEADADREREANILKAVEAKNKEQARLISQADDLRKEEEKVREERSRLVVQLAEQERSRRMSESFSSEQGQYLENLRNQVFSRLVTTEATTQERVRRESMTPSSEALKLKREEAALVAEAAAKLGSA